MIHTNNRCIVGRKVSHWTFCLHILYTPSNSTEDDHTKLHSQQIGNCLKYSSFSCPRLAVHLHQSLGKSLQYFQSETGFCQFCCCRCYFLLFVGHLCTWDFQMITELWDDPVRNSRHLGSWFLLFEKGCGTADVWTSVRAVQQ